MMLSSFSLKHMMRRRHLRVVRLSGLTSFKGLIGLVTGAAMGAGMSLGLAGPAMACAEPPPSLMAEEADLRAALRETPAVILDAMDTYSIGMEACYDAALGPLELAPLAKQAKALFEHMKRLRQAAQNEVRDDEFAYEDLLASDHWAHIEALRVAAAYADAWAVLAEAVRHIAANDKKDGLMAAQKTLRALSFEFKHPQLVQRAMYGLATAQIEGGQLAEAKASLERLQSSLKRGGNRDFARSVDAFYRRISDERFVPPPPLFAASLATDEARSTDNRPASVQGAMAAVELARQALREARPADEIVGLLRPALSGDAAALRAALDLIARDQLLLEAMDYEPGQSLRVMRLAFAGGQYAQLEAAWAGVKAYYPHLPMGLKRRVDYQLGVALLNLGALDRAVSHLWAARKTLNDGPQAEALDKMIALAQLSYDTPPDAARLALARGFQDIALPPLPGDTPTGIAGPPPLDVALLLRARVVLARHEAAQKNWRAADKLLSGIGPDWPAYQLFLGMRVRLLAQAVSDQMKAAKADEADSADMLARQKTARGAFALYRLWQNSDCPPGCLSGDRLAVHRAAMTIAMQGGLTADAFGRAFGSFVDEGGEVRPLMAEAIAFLVAARAPDRLVQLLDRADEADAAFALGQWKAFLAETVDMKTQYDWLATGSPELTGRPQAVVLEALIAHDLKSGRAANALPHAEKLAANFPRRPSAWFYRAAVLAANERHLEGARTLASLAGRTPADDPVGMGARLGLAALFIALERGDQACAMRAKIFSRPQADELWQSAKDAFPLLGDWQKTTDRACKA